MCIVKPKTKDEMLSVSGVGEFKYEKYGGRFLTCVQGESKTPLQATGYQTCSAAEQRGI